MNILLVCNAGMSTSFVVNKMKKAMKDLGKEGRIEAHASTDLKTYINEFDVVLIAPHLEYMKREISAVCAEHHKKCDMVPSKYYGVMDGMSIVKYVFDNLGD